MPLKAEKYTKRFLAITIASIATGGLPVASETALKSIPGLGKSGVWLVLLMGNSGEEGSLTTLPMKSMYQCEKQQQLMEFYGMT